MKEGKAKEVSYNALASHIISEDGDNPEVGESREVFDLPVVKVSTYHTTACFFLQQTAYGRKLRSYSLLYLRVCPDLQKSAAYGGGCVILIIGRVFSMSLHQVASAVVFDRPNYLAGKRGFILYYLNSCYPCMANPFCK